MDTDKLIEQLISGERFFNESSNAHLAGGAVRDSLFCKPVSDYDLFVNHPIGLAQEEMLLYKYPISHEVRVLPMPSRTMEWTKDGIRLIKTSKEYYKESDFLAYRSEDGKLNVMLCRNDFNIEQKIRSFPVSLSQIGIRLSERGHGKLVVGEGFVWSMKKRLALYHTKDEYVKKIMAKYSDWEWAQVAPDDWRMGGPYFSYTGPVIEEF